MAVLPIEQVTQRNRTGDVSIVHDLNASATGTGEKLWLSTLTFPNTIVNTKSVVANQQVYATMETRITNAGVAAQGAKNLYTLGNGSLSNPEPLTLIGDGSEAFTVSAAAGPYYYDVDAFVEGGFQPLTMTIHNTSETSNGTYSVKGLVLVADGTSAGTDTIQLDITDRDNTTVRLVVVVTVSA